MEKVQTNATFLIDGQERGSLHRLGNGINGNWTYNFSAFKVSDLNADKHQLTIRQGSSSLIVLDYISYIAIDATSTTSSITSSSNLALPSSTRENSGDVARIGAVIGGVIGGVLLLIGIIIGVGFFVYRRRHRSGASLEKGKAHDTSLCMWKLRL